MIVKRLRLLSSALRKTIAVRLYPNLEIGPDLQLSKGAVLQATDGGKIGFGADCAIASNATLIAKFGAIHIGARGHIGIGAVLTCRDSITIGEDVLIAEYVTIRDQDHGYSGVGPFADQPFETAPVVLGNNVWLGAKVTILKGVTIGDNTVVGANSVVTGDLPADIIAAGSPARVIRSRIKDRTATDTASGQR